MEKGSIFTAKLVDSVALQYGYQRSARGVYGMLLRKASVHGTYRHLGRLLLAMVE